MDTSLVASDVFKSLGTGLLQRLREGEF